MTGPLFPKGRQSSASRSTGTPHPANRFRFGPILIALAAAPVMVATVLTFEADSRHPLPLRANTGEIVRTYLALHLLLWIPVLVLAWQRSRVILLFLGFRLAVFAALVTVAMAMFTIFGPGDGPAGLAAMVFATLLLAMLAIDTFVWIVSLSRNWLHLRSGLVSATGLYAAIMLGWLAGITLWSERLPARILADAAGYAADRSSCIVTGRTLATRDRDLTAWAIWWRWTKFTPDLHAVLVMDDANGARTYANWSFRAGRFLDLKQSTLDALGASQYDCRPRPGFIEAL